MNNEDVKNTLDTYVMNTYGRYDLVIDHAHGSIVYDKDGKEYIDCVAGIAVNNIGHTHKKMTENLSKQLEKMIHVSNLYYTEEQATFAKRETLSDLENIEQIIKTLSEDKNLKMLWKDYQDKFKYAKNVKYEETIKAIEFIKNIII